MRLFCAREQLPLCSPLVAPLLGTVGRRDGDDNIAVVWCRYLPINYNCLASATLPLSSHRVVIEWASHQHQPIRFSYVVGTIDVRTYVIHHVIPMRL